MKSSSSPRASSPIRQIDIPDQFEPGNVWMTIIFNDIDGVQRYLEKHRWPFKSQNYSDDPSQTFIASFTGYREVYVSLQMLLKMKEFPTYCSSGQLIKLINYRDDIFNYVRININPTQLDRLDKTHKELFDQLLDYHETNKNVDNGSLKTNNHTHAFLPNADYFLGNGYDFHIFKFEYRIERYPIIDKKTQLKKTDPSTCKRLYGYSVFSIEDKIGSGGFGQICVLKGKIVLRNNQRVYIAYPTINKPQVNKVIKISFFNREKSESNQKEYVKNEFQISRQDQTIFPSRKKHINPKKPNFLKEKGKIVSASMVMNYFEKESGWSNLHDFRKLVKSNGIKLTDLNYITIVINLLEELDTWHTHGGIIVKDVKPQNILINKNDLSIILIDHAFSYEIATGPITTQTLGTRTWYPPEHFKKININNIEASIFAMGQVILYLFEEPDLNDFLRKYKQCTTEERRKFVDDYRTSQYDENASMNCSLPPVLKSNLSSKMSKIVQETVKSLIESRPENRGQLKPAIANFKCAETALKKREVLKKESFTGTPEGDDIVFGLVFSIFVLIPVCILCWPIAAGFGAIGFTVYTLSSLGYIGGSSFASWLIGKSFQEDDETPTLPVEAQPKINNLNESSKTIIKNKTEYTGKPKSHEDPNISGNNSENNKKIPTEQKEDIHDEKECESNYSLSHSH